jgi:hypothetical protein
MNISKRNAYSFIVICMALFLSSCVNNNSKGNTASVETNDSASQVSSMDDITKHLMSLPESFSIDPTKDTLIKCKKGSMLKLVANSLVLEDGSAPSGPVKIDIIECYTTKDFIGNKLVTSSGNQILETGGMLNIGVTNNGKNLKIKEGKNYTVYFPSEDKKDGMQLFYGNHNANGNTDWTLAEPLKKETPSISIPTVSIPKTLSNTYECKLKINGRTTGIGDKNVEWKIKKTGQTIDDYFAENFKISDAMKDEICDKNHYFRMNFYLDNNGKVKNLTFSEIVNPSINKFFSNFFYSLPPFDMNSMADCTPTTELLLHISGDIFFDKEGYNKNFKEKYATYKNKKVDKIDPYELNNYVQTATKFGWINCDKFWNTPEEKISFIVSTNEGTDTKIIIVFKNVKSIMQGEYQENGAVFSNIPIKQPIKVIGISYTNGAPTMAVAETTTGKAVYELSDFKAFTLDQLEAELNKMN